MYKNQKYVSPVQWIVTTKYVRGDKGYFKDCINWAVSYSLKGNQIWLY